MPDLKPLYTLRPPSAGEYFQSDSEADPELARLRRQEAFNDPVSMPRLERTGISEGWLCADVGAGAGSATRWLAGRVGPSGKIVATEHLPDPVGALKRMTKAVRTGGYVLVEDSDYGHLYFHGPDADKMYKTWLKMSPAAVKAFGLNTYIGRTLPGLFMQAWLDLVEAECVTMISRPGELRYISWGIAFAATLACAVSAGVISDDEAQPFASFFQDPNTALTNSTLVSVLGQRSS